MQNEITVGMLVRVKARMFKPPYAPYYDVYKGHWFRVLKIDHEHCRLKCVSDESVIPSGWPHDDELEPIKTSEIIREAQTYLWPNGNDDEFDVRQHSTFLCWCMIFVENLQQVLALNLEDCISRASEKTKNVCRILESETDFAHDCRPSEVVQESRFMYSEFLALYFEDMGD